MAYQALYRAWRPQRFADLIGQEHLSRTLRHALMEQRLAHAYLLSGPRGTGKTSAAKVLAKAVNCEQAPTEEPCNVCAACTEITQGRLMDVMEIDAASNRGVDEIRELREHVKYAPSKVAYKVYIIDEVHMLTSEAFNALLKTLEEPPEHALFVLATTEPQKIPLTILSRCQRFDFRRISVEEMVRHMQEITVALDIEADAQALVQIARLADGGLRDALGLLDQVVSFCEGRVGLDDVLAVTGGVSPDAYLRLASSIASGQEALTLERMDELYRQGKDPAKILEGLQHFYRDVMLLHTAPELVEVPFDRSQLEDLQGFASPSTLLRAMELLQESITPMKSVSRPRILLETALLKLCSIGQTISLEQQVQELQQRIVQLEKRNQLPSPKVEKVDPPPPASTTERDEKAPPWKKEAPKPQKEEPKADEAKVDEPDRQKWEEVLQGVKSRKMTTYAWLVDGQLASCDPEQAVVSFRTPLHRENTEKAPNRTLIEAVLQSVYGRPMRLVTTMQGSQGGEDARREEAAAQEEQPANLPQQQEESVSLAKEWFGADCVEVVDEGNESR